MQYAKDKRSGNQLSVLGLGCMRFPHKGTSIDMEKSEELILGSIKDGINYFDTAYLYPGSEETLGTVLARHNLRKDIFIATKLPIVFVKKREDFDKYFDKQLKQLQTDYVDYYLMHMLQDLSSWQMLIDMGIIPWIEEKKAKKQIKQIGFSFHGTKSEFVKILDAYDWDFCQIQYNYSNENYQAGIEGLRKAAAKDIPVIIMEPLLGGKLVDGLPKQAVALFNNVNSELTLAQWGLKWLWNQPEVSLILSGMSNMDMLSENVQIAEIAQPNMLTKEEYKVFDDVIEIFNASNKIPCTGCGYCMPCPKNVNISGCFAAYNALFSHDKKTGMNQYRWSTGATSQNPSDASLCVKCGKCEKHCPQNIAIISELEVVKKKMEPFWYQPIIKIIRAFTSKKRPSN